VLIIIDDFKSGDGIEMTMNICGVLVHARSGEQEQVKKRLEQQSGVEVHALTEEGRLVVTVEDESHKVTADVVIHLQDVEGVLSAAMIYQYSDFLESSEQEVSQ